jgi:hypothetical protein
LRCKSRFFEAFAKNVPKDGRAFAALSALTEALPATPRLEGFGRMAAIKGRMALKARWKGL